jgi:hypothetical protein
MGKGVKKWDGWRWYSFFNWHGLSVVIVVFIL